MSERIDKLARVSVRQGNEARAKDFIAVFEGSSNAEQGQRVLKYLSGFCNLPIANPRNADKPGTLAFNEGKRWIWVEIMAAFDPSERIPEIESKKRTSDAGR